MKLKLMLGMIFLSIATLAQTLRKSSITTSKTAGQVMDNSYPQSTRQTTLTCNNWLRTPTQPSYIDIGNLNITGNKLTVEAVFNRTSPWSGPDVFQGDLVSKHSGPSDCNYLLRPGSAEITTTNGYFKTPTICNIQLNKTYHAAMVYDGAMLKFYRNGFLMSQIAASGNLFQNSWKTFIGYYEDQVTAENFIGYTNEVRIWNIARTQSDIRMYMNNSLPNPTTQTGLLAYYTFDNLLNKQGNPTWNGTLSGSASINNTNTSCTFVADSCAVNVVQAGFSIPDTVCVNTLVNIINTSTGTTTYSWNFCVADLNGTPQALNIGNPGNILSQPAFLDFVLDNGNYYGFSTNHFPGKLVRLNFGNSLLNTPTVTDLGNFGGIIPAGYGSEGIQIVRNESKWYIIIVGGSPNSGSIPKIIKIELGASIINNAPVATDWGNIGNLAQPIDLIVFQENNSWYGLTVNAENNTVTRFNFSNSFNNIPIGLNLGNLGGLNYPTGLHAVYDNGVWRAFITNGAYNTGNPNPSLTRLDFGNSLINIPTAINLGNPGGLLSQPRDITVVSTCGQAFGYVVNGTTNSITKLNFNNNLQSVPVAGSLGNIGNLNFPHSISKLFRSGPDLYAFITNINNNTITRLRFAGCTNSSLTSSTLQSPPPVVYNIPGVYNINLAIDEGLSTQVVVCKQITVLPEPLVSTRTDTTICKGTSVQLNTTSSNATSYSWSPATGLSNPSVASPLASPQVTTAYIVTANNGYCQKSDTVTISVNANCNSTGALTCDNWLRTPTQPSYVNIGNLNVTGNKVTVEAVFNRTSPWSGPDVFQGDLVSKHSGPSDCNYLLRPGSAEITTTNGYFKTPVICPIQLNKTYHAAMVYDGVTLKFYRNGFLMSQIAATGSLFQNSWKTFIGYYEDQVTAENFIGYINEVRIWNVARSQSDIRTYMNGSLPNPNTQTGLQAYYTFDNLLNKQGNTAWNGTLGGTASINNTNPSCNLVVDTCGIVPNGISNIINTYTPVTGFLPCENKLTVEDGSTFNVGDTVLIIQMKGAVVDTTNTAAFGTVISYGNAGNYEFNYVKSRTGNVVELKNNLTRQYTIPVGKVQLIRVPYYYSTDVSSTLTCLPWDGNKGGVLVFNVRDTLTLSADMDVTGKGFRGGEVVNSNINTFSCSFTDYYYPVNTINAAGKGESIADLTATKNAGKGAKASAGGGGMNPNTGGGGGGNGNTGGRGGFGYGDCPNYTTAQNWGLGGYSLLFNNSQNKIYLGGGGGAGHCNNGFTDPSINTNFNGGNGGGIIIVTAKTIAGNNKNIISQGNIPYELTGPGFLAHDGMGGGGAGGTVLLNAETYISNINTNVAGARGGNMSSSPTGGKVGPGGGGSGGAVWVKQATTPAAIIVNAAGGTNGIILQDGNNPYGAEPGLTGITRTALVVPVDTVLFQKNIDSVRIKDSLYNCNVIDFKGFGFVRLAPIVNWQWTFGDGGTASTQNTIHPYQNAGNYLVKLVVTDANGCKDSITRPVTILGANTSDFSFELNPCNPLQVNFISNASSPVINYWSFGDGSTLLNTQSPSHTFVSGGNYIIRYSSTTGGCTDTITKTVSVGVAYQNIILTNDTTICPGATKQLLTLSSGPFCWSPATYLNNPLLANPVTNTPQNITYYFTSLITGNNLITNGNFSGGNTGFTSEYIFTAANNSTSDQYNVSNNAGVWLGNGVACNADHTTGSGNMLMVNGATTANKKVWVQNITVVPNTNYEISGWMAGLGTTNPSKIQYAVNGLKVGNQITASSTNCQWNRFSTIWNSGNRTAIELSIINISTDVQGNDFALDDLSFTTVSIRRDSVIIRIDTPVVRAGNDTSVCRSDTLRLQATGSQAYTWLPSAGLSNPNISNPIATPLTNTQYIVTGTSAFGCTAKDTVNIVINPSPVISALTNDTIVCRNVPLQLNASGGTSYNWQPAGTLSNPQTANPIATPVLTTTYYVTVTGANNCNVKDSVKVSVAAPPSFAADPVKSTCLGEQVQLRAAGGNSYLWTPVNGLSANNVSNPMAGPSITTTYTVKIKESTCNDSATLNVLVNVLPLPDVQVNKANDIDCSVGLARLNATGATTYRWAPGGSLSDSTSANPTAIPQVSTLYTVTGYSSDGCANTDTLSVLVKYEGNGVHYMPNAFTPNGDGLNECFGIKNWGQVTDLTFAIYNRWGERVFFTTNPGVCWNGRYKNELQQSGNFVYIVKAKTACGGVDMKGSVLLIR